MQNHSVPPSGAPDCNVSHAGEAASALQLRHAAFRLINGKWKAEIIWAPREEKRRFGEIPREIPGITQHVLTAQLRDLEAHGLVERTVYAEVPPRVEYELTEAAIDLRAVYGEMYRWAGRHRDILVSVKSDEALA